MDYNPKRMPCPYKAFSKKRRGPHGPFFLYIRICGQF
jgi:hypothetical protein